jgi:hypothetical protein
MRVGSFTASAIMAVSLVGIGWWFGSRNPPATPITRTEPDVLDAIAQLRDEIASLRHVVAGAGSQSAADPVREPAPTDSEPLAGISTRLDALANALEGMRSLLGSLSTTWDAEQARASVPKNDGALVATRAVLQSDASLADLNHFCWTRQQVYRQYGKPDSISWSGKSISWEYYPGRDQDGIKFEFVDGLVSSVSWCTDPNPR